MTFHEEVPSRASESSQPSDDEKTVQGLQLESALLSKKLKDGRVDSKVDTEESERVVESLEDDFPDGGLRAWLVVLGAALGNACTFGYVNAWGIFQTYYEETLLRDTSPSTIAWIGSVQYALTFMPGLFVGQLFDRGYMRVPFALASVMLVTTTLLVAECKVYWQFLLCQGFAVGIFSGLTFGPMVAVIAHWFKKRKGLALGCMAFGSSCGATIFPIVVLNLIKTVGFQWTMRILALIILCLLVVSNLTVARRLPPKENPGPIISLHEFKSPAYAMYCLSGFVTFLGLYTVLTYIGVSAAFKGIDPNFSAYLISIANAGSAAGRITTGFLADRYGYLNMMIPAVALSSITTFIWPFVSTKGGFITIGIINGLFTGVYASMLAAPIISMGETQTVGVRVGMFFSILALGALAGPPISGAINTATGNYEAVGYFAGGSIMVAIVCLITARYLILGRFRGKA